MPEHYRSFVVAQLLRDIEWLRAHHFMDYSLLIGVKHAPSPSDPSSLPLLALPEPAPKPQSIGPSSSAKQSSLFVPKSTVFKRAISDSRVTNPLQQQPPATFICPSLTGDEVFYFGIIDILTQWNSMKVIAHTIKRTQTHVKSLSTVDPNYYASRWDPFLKEIFKLDFILL